MAASRKLCCAALVGAMVFMAAPANSGERKSGPANPEGVWVGKMQVGAVAVRVVVHINKQGNGFTGTVDSPDQSVNGVPCAVFAADGKVRFVIAPIGATFEGQLNAEGDTIAGVWHQAGQRAPLQLARSATTMYAPQLIVLVFWVPVVLLAAFFLRMACSLCRANMPSWRRALISTFLVSFLAYLMFDFTAYVVMRSMQDVLIHVPPWYSYQIWFRESINLKWFVISHAGVFRFVPIVFALCMAGTLQVIVLQADVTFRFGLLIVLMQWGATVVAAYVLSLLFGVGLSAMGWEGLLAAKVPEQVQTHAHARPPTAADNQKAGKSDPKKTGTPTPDDGLARSFQIFDEETDAYFRSALSNVKTYADSHLDELKESAEPYTRHLPQAVQDFLEAGGWWAILGVLAFICVLWMRSLLRRLAGALTWPKKSKKKRRAKRASFDLKVNLKHLGDALTDEGSQRVIIKGQPARLRLVVLSLGTHHDAELHEDMVGRILDWIKPGLAAVTAGDYPAIRVWPNAPSIDGFANTFAAKVAIPEPKGEKSHWVLVNGQVRMGQTIIHVGLAFYADQENSLRVIKVPDEQWLDVMGVRPA